jgi:hypothetical protein
VISHEERNRFILRRTLSAVAWICAAWSVLLGAPLTGMPKDDIRRLGWTMLGHGVLLAASGAGLWKPRVWGWPATFLAVLGSAGFMAVDILHRNAGAALVDGLFPLVSLWVFVRTRSLTGAPGGSNIPFDHEK